MLQFPGKATAMSTFQALNPRRYKAPSTRSLNTSTGITSAHPSTNTPYTWVETIITASVKDHTVVGIESSPIGHSLPRTAMVVNSMGMGRRSLVVLHTLSTFLTSTRDWNTSATEAQSVTTTSLTPGTALRNSTQNITVPWETICSSSSSIPGLQLHCQPHEGWQPCYAACPEDDSACYTAASSIGATCGLQWAAYWSASDSWCTASCQSSLVPSTITTSTVRYPSTSVAKDSYSYIYTLGPPYAYMETSIVTPKYVFGDPTTIFNYSTTLSLEWNEVRVISYLFVRFMTFRTQRKTTTWVWVPKHRNCLFV